MMTARALDKEYNRVVHTGKSERPTPLISLSKARWRDNPFLGTKIPPHDPEKWAPVFGKDHAQTNLVTE
jgi:hypothetical protein